MLLEGKKIEGPNEEVIVLPRLGEPIVLIARAILDMSQFEKLCPRPSPPILRLKSGERKEDIEHPRYKKEIDEYAEKRLAYMVLKSLEATPELEWETADIHDSSTWLNYKKELSESGFSDVEVNRVILGVMTANCMNEEKLDQARKLFLAGRQEQNGSLSQREEVNTIPSSEPVNA